MESQLNSTPHREENLFPVIVSDTFKIRCAKDQSFTLNVLKLFSSQIRMVPAKHKHTSALYFKEKSQCSNNNLLFSTLDTCLTLCDKK